MTDAEIRLERYLKLYTVRSMARDFKVNRLSDEFGQYLLLLKCLTCLHERQSYPNTLAHWCGWNAPPRVQQSISH